MGLTVNNIISNDDFNNLVSAVKAECNRRHYTDALIAPNIPTKNDGDSITYSEVNTLLSSICGLDAFPSYLDTGVYIATNNSEQYVTLKNFQYNIIKALDAVSSTISTASRTTNIESNTDCRGNCAGLCTGCTGSCTGSCTDSCTSCTGSCAGGCYNSCYSYCQNNCLLSCFDNCDSGCQGTCQGCSSSCSGCSGCTNGCSKGCAGYIYAGGSQGRPK